jgi:hypothetical protein
MAKIYTENPFDSNTLKPKKETVDFLLNYSKALNVSVYKGHKFESLKN